MNHEEEVDPNSWAAIIAKRMQDPKFRAAYKAAKQRAAQEHEKEYAKRSPEGDRLAGDALPGDVHLHRTGVEFLVGDKGPEMFLPKAKE